MSLLLVPPPALSGQSYQGEAVRSLSSMHTVYVCINMSATSCPCNQVLGFLTALILYLLCCTGIQAFRCRPVPTSPPLAIHQPQAFVSRRALLLQRSRQVLHRGHGKGLRRIGKKWRVALRLATVVVLAAFSVVAVKVFYRHFLFMSAIHSVFHPSHPMCTDHASKGDLLLGFGRYAYGRGGA